MFFVNLFNKIINNLTTGYLTLSKPVIEFSARFLLYIANNNKLLDNYKIMKMIYHRLQSDPNFIKFAYKKNFYKLYN
jgi:hypothetical protein